MRGPLKTLRSAIAALLPTHRKTLQALTPLSRVALEPRGGAEGGADLEDEWGVCISGRIQFESPVESGCGCKIVDAWQEGEAAKGGATEVRVGGKSFAGAVGGTGLRFAI